MQTQVPFRGPTTPWSHIGRCLTLALAVAGCDGAEGPVTTTTEDGGTDTSTGEPEPPPPACLPGDETPTLELGNGEAGFMDSDAVTLVYGPQGGYHIVLGLRATYLDASASLSASFTGSIDGEVLGSGSPSVTLACNRGTEFLETSGILLIWDGDVTPDQLEGKMTTVEVGVTDASGSTINASRDFLIMPP